MENHTTVQQTYCQWSSQQLADWGENAAAEFLIGNNYHIRGRNIGYDVGEIDIIATDPTGVVVFVEVKTRSGENYGVAESVTGLKLLRLRKAAYCWLSDQPYADIRFDVIAIVVDPTTINAPATLNWFQGVENGAR